MSVPAYEYGQPQLSPLWLNLAGRRVVLIGGGVVAARRARGFVGDGADVVVISPQLEAALAQLVAAGEVTWLRRAYGGPSDLAEAWLVHAATGDPQVDRAVADDAEATQKYCVVASQASWGSAAVPARTSVPVDTDTVQVSVHGGNDPRRAIAVRDAIADLLDSGAIDLTRRRMPNRGWAGRPRRALRVIA